MATGTVVNWKADKGYGFIKPDSDGPDVFLHVAELDGVASGRIKKDVRVEYRLGQGDRGPKACAVTLASGSTPADDGLADFVPAAEFGQEILTILSEAAESIVRTAKRHGWVG